MDIQNLDAGKNYMKFVTNFHNLMVKRNLILAYEGEVNQDITKAFTSMAQRNLEDEAESTKTSKRVYHVMVECLQNICKHADDIETGEPENPGSGIFMISRQEDTYIITTGNVISNKQVPLLEEMLEKFNSLNPDEIKQLYKKMIKESRLSAKAGAGLGLIDIIKKTGNKLDYSIEKINDVTSFFIQKSTVNRE